MKTVSMNTILDLLDYYWEICDEDVDAGNRLICTLEDLLPFNGYDAVKEWALITECGTGEEWLEATKEVLWNAACEDYSIIRDAVKHSDFCEWSLESKRFCTTSAIRWDNDVKKPVATIIIDMPYIGYSYCDEWVWQGVSFCDFVEDTLAALRLKMKQIARRLGKEFEWND